MCVCVHTQEWATDPPIVGTFVRMFFYYLFIPRAYIPRAYFMSQLMSVGGRGSLCAIS